MPDLILGSIFVNTKLAFSSMSADQGMPDSCLNNQFRAVGRALN